MIFPPSETTEMQKKTQPSATAFAFFSETACGLVKFDWTMIGQLVWTDSRVLRPRPRNTGGGGCCQTLRPLMLALRKKERLSTVQNHAQFPLVTTQLEAAAAEPSESYGAPVCLDPRGGDSKTGSVISCTLVIE